MPASLCYCEATVTKANFTLPNGTTIEIEGSLEEIQQLADHVGRAKGPVTPTGKPASPPYTSTEPGGGEDEQPDIARIVAIIKDCDEAEAIAKRVLDRTDMLNNVLLCMW